MLNISYKHIKKIEKGQLKALYKNAGWISYIKELSKLVNSIESSLMTISAWDDEKLVGLIRVVGDGQTII